MESLFVTALVGAILAPLGYFGRRWIEGHGKDQSLKRKKQILDIHKAMQEQSLSTGDLADLEKVLLGRANRPLSVGVPQTTPLEAEVVRLEDTHALNQNEMNEMAARQLTAANSELDNWLAQIEEAVGSNRIEQLQFAQSHWEEFSEEQAGLVSSKYKGGSILPYIYLVERERLVRERIEQLKRLHHDETSV